MLTKKVHSSFKIKEVIQDEKTVAKLEEDRKDLEKKSCNCNCKSTTK